MKDSDMRDDARIEGPFDLEGGSRIRAEARDDSRARQGRPGRRDDYQVIRQEIEEEPSPIRQGVEAETAGHARSGAGHVVLTFGFPGSGKTTLYSALMRYAMEVGPFNVTIGHANVTDDGPSYDTNRLLDQWRREWRSGRFPKSTPVGENEIKELNFRIQPIQGRKDPLDFSFIEVSGEDLKTVIPGQTRNPTLTRVIEEILRNDKCRLSLMVVAHPDVHENDDLFFNFLDYVERTLGIGDIRKRASLALVVADPDRALETLKSRRDKYDDLRELKGEAVEAFIAEMMPQTYRAYRNWPGGAKRRVMTRLYLGRVEPDGEGEPILRTYSSRSSQLLFNWMFKMFKGYEPGLTAWQRFRRWIRS